MVSQGQIELFNSRKDEWDSWNRRFDQWLSISPYATGDDADNRKHAAFCTFIDSETFKLLCTLCTPKKPEECTYVELKNKLKKQFGTKKLVLAESYHFYAYKQHERQSLSDYLAELRRLALTCQWSEGYLADNLCDKFVMGLRNERILQQLLTQDHTKSLNELFQLTTIIEATKQETVKCSEVDRTAEEEPSVLALRNSRPPKGTQNKQSGLPRRQQQRVPRKQHTGKCASCGGDHARKTCRFISVKCHNCGKIGNIARVCGAKTVVITEQHPSESAVVTISQNSKQLQMDIPPMFQILHLPQMHRWLSLMVDSASPITFINIMTWKDLEKPQLQSTDRVLGAFEGQPIKPLGYFLTPVLREDDTSKPATLPICFTQGSKHPRQGWSGSVKYLCYSHSVWNHCRSC